MNNKVKAVKYVKPITANQNKPPFTRCSPFNTSEKFNHAKIGVETKEQIIAKESIFATSLIKPTMMMIPIAAAAVIQILRLATELSFLPKRIRNASLFARE